MEEFQEGRSRFFSTVTGQVLRKYAFDTRLSNFAFSCLVKSIVAVITIAETYLPRNSNFRDLVQEQGELTEDEKAGITEDVVRDKLGDEIYSELQRFLEKKRIPVGPDSLPTSSGTSSASAGGINGIDLTRVILDKAEVHQDHRRHSILTIKGIFKAMVGEFIASSIPNHPPKLTEFKFHCFCPINNNAQMKVFPNRYKKVNSLTKEIEDTASLYVCALGGQTKGSCAFKLNEDFIRRRVRILKDQDGRETNKQIMLNGIYIAFILKLNKEAKNTTAIQYCPRFNCQACPDSTLAFSLTETTETEDGEEIQVQVMRVVCSGCNKMFTLCKMPAFSTDPTNDLTVIKEGCVPYDDAVKLVEEKMKSMLMLL